MAEGDAPDDLPEDLYDPSPYDAPEPDPGEDAATGAMEWEPLPDAPAEAPASFPVGAFILAMLAFAAVAYARIDALAATLTLDPFTRTDMRSIALEVGTLLFSGTFIATGATAGRLSGGAKTALVLVGALILLGLPGSWL